mmetsp:Transcript_48301/g.154246  ORF Transcript_48301/g.154246 Transcript_48301/m.154246 type:complete len:208 (-) Transcript_48301:207-830(-)
MGIFQKVLEGISCGSVVGPWEVFLEAMVDLSFFMLTLCGVSSSVPSDSSPDSSSAMPPMLVLRFFGSSTATWSTNCTRLSAGGESPSGILIDSWRPRPASAFLGAASSWSALSPRPSSECRPSAEPVSSGLSSSSSSSCPKSLLPLPSSDFLIFSSSQIGTSICSAGVQYSASRSEPEPSSSLPPSSEELLLQTEPFIVPKLMGDFL